MEKVKFDIKLNERQLSIRNQTIKNLLNNKILLKFLE